MFSMVIMKLQQLGSLSLIILIRKKTPGFSSKIKNDD